MLLDVSAIREVHTAGLALLAFALGSDDRVTCRGLSRRHERFVAYLLGRASAGAPRAGSPSHAA